MTVYHLAYPNAQPLEVQPTGYGDIPSAMADAMRWSAALGRLIQVYDDRGQRVAGVTMPLWRLD